MGELNPDVLLELVSKFFPEAERKQDEIKEIIALLHGHTFAGSLAAVVFPLEIVRSPRGQRRRMGDLEVCEKTG